MKILFIPADIAAELIEKELGEQVNKENILNFYHRVKDTDKNPFIVYDLDEFQTEFNFNDGRVSDLGIICFCRNNEVLFRFRIEPDDVAHFVSISKSQLTKETVNLLKEHGLTYKDQILKEHIYNVEATKDALENVSDELDELSQFLEMYDTSYVRIIPD